MKSDSHALIACLVGKTPTWLAYKVNEQGTAVSISCEMEKFLEQMEVTFLLCLPSPDALGAAAQQVPIGSSSGESKKKADDLKEELEKICEARDGLRKALFTQDELEKLFEKFSAGPAALGSA